MVWSIERVRQDWLEDGRVSVEDDGLVAAFNTVAEMFGEDWLESLRNPAGALGPLPTLAVVVAGQLIRAVEDVEDADALLERFRRHEPGAAQELLTLAAIRAADPDIDITLGPQVEVAGRSRIPDLKLAKAGTDVFVEVSSTQTSSAASEVLDDLHQDRRPCSRGHRLQ